MSKGSLGVLVASECLQNIQGRNWVCDDRVDFDMNPRSLVYVLLMLVQS